MWDINDDVNEINNSNNNNGGYNNNGYNNNGYNNSGYNNNGYNNNGYNNSGYNNNGYNNNGYNNNGYNNSDYNNNGYNNSGYNNSYNSYNSTDLSTSTASTRSSTGGGSSFLFLIFAVAAALFLLVTIGTEFGKIKNCKETTKGVVVDVIQTKQRVRKKNHKHSSTRYKYYYRAKIAYEVDGEPFVLDVPKSKCRFSNGQTETVHYNKNNPSESYSDRYMDHKKTDAMFTVGIIVIGGFLCIFKRKTTGIK
ncbi:MAG TPA: DUF3592 domain-containing protein [Ruminococcus flavefaciens]|nr:DUF3592 domain-containing protein [Ruminococcus flavefaciens]HQL99232.1 DUF3592 domain-containing protein [Ruminococcus flavefaciens]